MPHMLPFCVFLDFHASQLLNRFAAEEAGHSSFNLFLCVCVSQVQPD